MSDDGSHYWVMILKIGQFLASKTIGKMPDEYYDRLFGRGINVRNVHLRVKKAHGIQAKFSSYVPTNGVKNLGAFSYENWLVASSGSSFFFFFLLSGDTKSTPC